MNFDPSAESPVAHAVVGMDGVLRSADPALIALNQRAGGENERCGKRLQIWTLPAMQTVARLHAAV